MREDSIVGDNGPAKCDGWTLDNVYRVKGEEGGYGEDTRLGAEAVRSMIPEYGEGDDSIDGVDGSDVSYISDTGRAVSREETEERDAAGELDSGNEGMEAGDRGNVTVVDSSDAPESDNDPGRARSNGKMVDDSGRLRDLTSGVEPGMVPGCMDPSRLCGVDRYGESRES